MPAASAMPQALLAPLGDMLGERTGLDFPPRRWADLERGVESARRELGFPDAAAYARWLMADRRSTDDIDRLVSHVTVGETYFYRDPAVWEAMEHLVLPDLMRMHSPHGRRLRIWSAGCSTGEEAYTMAMTVDRALPGTGRDDVTILATDMNPRYLRQADRGVYGSWSFRSTPASALQRYFTPLRDGKFQVRSEIRAMVKFRRLNLAEDAYPDPASGIGDMDLIVCRNVLMYFSPARVKETAGRLRRALREGGWLFVAPAEMSADVFPSLRTVTLPGTLAYRNAGTDPAPTCVVPNEPESPATAASARTPAAHTPAWRPRSQATVADAETAESPADAARRCANEGKLDEAMRWSDRALAADRLDPQAHFVRAAILRERGDVSGAIEALNRAVYLDPAHVLAQVTLGHLFLAQCRPGQARRHLDGALELLERLAPDDIVEHSEGLAAARLAQVVRMLRSRAGEAARGARGR